MSRCGTSRKEPVSIPARLAGQRWRPHGGRGFDRKSRHSRRGWTRDPVRAFRRDGAAGQSSAPAGRHGRVPERTSSPARRSSARPGYGRADVHAECVGQAPATREREAYRRVPTGPAAALVRFWCVCCRYPARLKAPPPAISGTLLRPGGLSLPPVRVIAEPPRSAHRAAKHGWARSDATSRRSVSCNYEPASALIRWRSP